MAILPNCMLGQYCCLVAILANCVHVEPSEPSADVMSSDSVLLVAGRVVSPQPLTFML